MKSRIALVLALAAAPFLPGCGAGGGITAVDTTQHKPVRSIVLQRGWELVPGQLLGVDVNFTGSGSGTADVTVEWTYASNDLDIYVTAQACTVDAFSAGSCAYTAKADGTTSKPERLTFPASAGSSYRVWVVNFGPAQESGTLEIGLTQ
jgi:hypothetical protein